MRTPLEHFILSALLCILCVGCAASESTTTPDGAADLEDVSAIRPRLKFTWRELASEHEILSYLPQEYAKPIFSPRLDDVITATSNGFLTRFRAGSGEIVWRVPMHESESPTSKLLPVHADPLLDDGTIYVASLTGIVQARDLDDGEVSWTYNTGSSMESALVLDEGRLFFMDASEVLYALDAETGKLLWRYKRRLPEYFTIKGAGIPVVDGDAVYCGFSDGTLAALQIDTGEPIWTSDLSNEETEFTDVDTRPIVSGDYIYTSSYSGGVFAISRLDGVIQWQVPLEGVTRMLKRGSTLILTSAQGRVISLDLKRRQANWSFRFESHIPVEVADFGPYLFVSTTAGPMTILDRETGEMLGRWHPSQGFNTPVVFEQRRGFALSNSGYLYAFEVAF